MVCLLSFGFLIWGLRSDSIVMGDPHVDRHFIKWDERCPLLFEMNVGLPFPQHTDSPIRRWTIQQAPPLQIFIPILIRLRAILHLRLAWWHVLLKFKRNHPNPVSHFDSDFFAALVTILTGRFAGQLRKIDLLGMPYALFCGEVHLDVAGCQILFGRLFDISWERFHLELVLGQIVCLCTILLELYPITIHLMGKILVIAGSASFNVLASGV